MPTAISLFSGAGGCSLGFKLAGYDILYANDIEKSAVSSYKKNFPNTLIDNEDIAKIDFRSVMKTLGIIPGELDILIGGPPCQGFSTAGSRFWDDPRNSLLKSYVSALSQIKPKWFLMENVEGLLTAKKGEYLLEALKAFISLGYNVRVDKIYAQEYGVPQRRKRVFVIGNLIGMDITLPAPLVNLGGAIFRNSDFTLRRAINGLPLARTDKNPISYNNNTHDEFEVYLRGGSKSVTLHTYKESSGIQLERISALSPGQTMKDIPEELQHESFKKRANRRVADGTPSDKRGGAPSGLKRLVYDEPCLTITGASTREFIHPEQNRPLTIRECARIQTFPDSFEFLGNSQEITQQIGNAIPPLLAQHFANHFHSLGFDGQVNLENRGLQCYSLTKADAMSPALNHTDKLLKMLSKTRNTNLNLF